MAPLMPRKLACKQAQCWFEKSDGATTTREPFTTESKSDQANKQTKIVISSGFPEISRRVIEASSSLV